VAKAATEYSTAWGTPDPRDPDAYPKVPGTPMPQWAWEFLRRRQNYRERWGKVVRPFLSGEGGFDLSAVAHNSRDALIRAGRQQLHWAPPWEALRAEFRVFGAASYNSTLDPRLAQPPAFDGLSTTVVHVHARAVGLPKVLIEFDTTLPIEPQLEGARRELRQVAGRHPAVRMHIEKFPRYLRLLDFGEDRTPDKEIGRYLFAGVTGTSLDDALRKNLEAAHRWQSNYLRIALCFPDRRIAAGK
jgi:hypothetical protein